MVMGRMSGNDEADYHAPHGGSAARVTTKNVGEIWEHNAKSLRVLLLWPRVAQDTDTEWDLKCWLVYFASILLERFQTNRNKSGYSRHILRFLATQAGFGHRNGWHCDCCCYLLEKSTWECQWYGPVVIHDVKRFVGPLTVCRCQCQCQCCQASSTHSHQSVVAQ